MAVQLPEGWTSGEKDVQIYEWRCPHGAACGKNNKLMYKKQDREDALTCGAWHLFDQEKHNGLHSTWEEAKLAAEEGLTSDIRTFPVFYDKEGVERDLPKRADDYSERGTGKGKHSGKASSGGCGGGGGRGDRWRDRSRRRRDRSRSSSRRPGMSRARETAAASAIVGRNTGRPIAIGCAGGSTPLAMREGPRAHEVVISRIELDEMIDGLTRAANSTSACADWCRNFATHAGQAFEDEKRSLEATKATLERFRRA